MKPLLYRNPFHDKKMRDKNMKTRSPFFCLQSFCRLLLAALLLASLTALPAAPSKDAHIVTASEAGAKLDSDVTQGGGTDDTALIQDLKDRGMFEDTLILWTTEFGRMPCAQGGKGRDHNPFVFTNWLAGGGIKGGVTHGQSDEWGFKPADRKQFTQGYDIHATVLHLLGLDHEKLTFRHNGANRRLTDVHGHVIKEIIA